VTKRTMVREDSQPSPDRPGCAAVDGKDSRPPVTPPTIRGSRTRNEHARPIPDAAFDRLVRGRRDEIDAALATH
jgi:hypothetical protein